MVMPKLLLGLFIIIFVSACSPALTASPSVEVMSPTLQQATVTASGEPNLRSHRRLPQQRPSFQHLLPVDPTLEATDPASVSLASGGLQLVEFFRFT